MALMYGNVNRALLLPGLPYLEHKLALADTIRWFGVLAPQPTHHAERADAGLRAIGLEEVCVSSHVKEYQHPLPLAARRHLQLTFQQLWGPELVPFRAQVGISEEEWTLWQEI